MLFFLSEAPATVPRRRAEREIEAAFMLAQRCTAAVLVAATGATAAVKWLRLSEQSFRVYASAGLGRRAERQRE